MNKLALGLARTSRDVCMAKIQYQRLRLQELELIKAFIGDELEETQGCFSQMEHQVSQIHQDLLGSRAVEPGSNTGQWARFRPPPSLQPSGVPQNKRNTSFPHSTCFSSPF